MKKLLETLDKCLEITKDYNKFLYLFSKDEGIKTMAKLNETACRIKYLAKMSGIKEVKHPTTKAIKEDRRTGSFVSIRPCSDEFEGKTYLGIYLGDVALGSSVAITDNALVCNWAGYNPGILIPDLGKIVYGCQSWWGIIESEDDLEKITDLDIENVWYVKALKQLQAEA